MCHTPNPLPHDSKSVALRTCEGLVRSVGGGVLTLAFGSQVEHTRGDVGETHNGGM